MLKGTAEDVCDGIEFVDTAVEVCGETELEGAVVGLRDKTELESTSVEICVETELDGTMVELCNDIEPEDRMVKLRDVICNVEPAEKLTRLFEEVNVGVSGGDNETSTVLEIMTVFDAGSDARSPNESIVAKGNGCSEAVKLVRQQSEPKDVCPAAPAQHHLLPLSSQRFTSV